MKRKTKKSLALLMSAAMLASAALPTMAAAANEATPTFDAISDLRYSATATTDGIATKGLLLSKSGAILDAALAKVKSDVLLVAGDLTEHGTQAEHDAVAAKLAAVEAKGKEVFVVPGEHDVQSTANLSAITKAQFATTYKDFGYAGGTYTDDLSHTVDVTLGGKTVSFFLLDTVGKDGNPTVNNAWATPLMTAAKAAGKEVVGVGHHPSISRGGVDYNLMGLLYSIANIKNADGKPMWTGDTFAGLDLNDESSISYTAAQEFATAGMSTFVSGHSLLMATATGSTDANIAWTDYCNGSMVGTGAGVRTIALAADGTSTTTVDYVDTIADGSVLELARAAYRAYMPTAVDEIVTRVQPVLIRAVEMVQEIGYLAIDGMDVSSIVPSGLQSLIKGPVKDLIKRILNDVKDSTTLTDVLFEVKNALLNTAVPKSATESTPMLDVLTDVIVTLHHDNTQVAPSLAPMVAELKGIVADPATSTLTKDTLACLVVNNFADALSMDCNSLITLINKVLDEQLQIANKNSLRAMLAGPVKFALVVSFNLWDTIDGAITTNPDGTPIPPEYKPSVLYKPLVSRILLMETNPGSTQLTKDRLISGLKEKNVELVKILIDSGFVGMI